MLKGNWYKFKGDNSVKIVLTPFWKGVYSFKETLSSQFRDHLVQFFTYANFN